MAKDRTRHARVMDSRREPQADMVAREAMQVIYDVSHAAVVGIGDFCCAVTDCLLDLADLAKKMEEAKNGKR